MSPSAAADPEAAGQPLEHHTPAPSAVTPTPASPAADPEEAAAIAAAIERFLADTAPPPTPSAVGQDGWLTAAMLEGVSRGDFADRAGPGADSAHRWINT
ncbi:MAG TPA: hypothetical protein VMG80_07395 [Solirubrobacteraceae bacterium]|nr:hypothetical protein [Solirubrobacteraceae bacterium]